MTITAYAAYLLALIAAYILFVAPIMGTLLLDIHTAFQYL